MSETDDTTTLEPGTPAAETAAQAEPEPAAEAAPAEPEAQVEEAPEAEAAPEPEAEAAPELEADAEPEPEVETESQPEADQAAEAEVEPDVPQAIDIPMPARVAKVFLCERGHRTTVLWSEPTTCQARPLRHGSVCGRPLYPIGELPEQVRKALNPLKASKKSSKK
jgi:hypothetical protein